MQMAISLVLATVTTVATAQCPSGTTVVDTFNDANGTAWTACEDLQQPGGSIALVSSKGNTEWFSKGYEVFGSAHDEQFYLHANKSAVMNDKADILAVQLLNNYSFLSWELVASAIPPIRSTGPVRAFVGSRGSSVDTTFNDAGEDAAGYGFPPPLSYVFNLTNQAGGGEYIKTGKNAPLYLNHSGMAEGLVGDELPIVVFYYTVADNSSYLPSTSSGFRYWTMVAAGTPDMEGGREQGVWFRFQQLECAGAQMAPPCKMIGKPQYWDTFWWSRSPAHGDTEVTGPNNASMPSASGFYATLLENRRWWGAELAAEGMMDVSLPSPATTNGTWLETQMKHHIIESMITWHDTWGPRYGVLPGYGITLQNGFEDVFTSMGMAALEVGAMEYAKGLINNQYRNYIRYDGEINYRAEEIAQQARMLTILAHYYSYGDGDADDVAFMLEHFDKAKALADLLMARRATSFQYGKSDPRYGMIHGLDEGDNFVHTRYHGANQTHWYAHAAETYRAFTDLGEVWTEIGAAQGRKDVAEHGAEILKIAPLLYNDLHVSMNKTVNMTSSPGHTCYSHRADGYGSYYGCSFRAWPELFYSGALTYEQTDGIYIQGLGLTTCEVGKFLSMGSPSGGGTRLFVHVPQGFPFGLLVHDMVERFLLHFFTQSAHTNTRGTWTTPESTTLDRDGYDFAYGSAGMGNVPMCLKWMLAFEEPETRTLWLGKAVPRDWLVLGEEPLSALGLTTRYGRTSFTLTVVAPTAAPTAASTAATPYVVHANITLPASYADKATQPAGGIRLRIRAPIAHAGKLSKVTIGGQAWTAFNAAEETIDIAAGKLTASLIATGLPTIVATFGATEAALLSLARH